MPETAPMILLGPSGLALAGLFAFATAFCLALVMRHDLVRFEIDFVALGVAALFMVPLILMCHGFTDALDALAMGALFGCASEALRRVMPGRMGAGDPPLFAVLGLAAGPAYAVVVLLIVMVVSFCVALAWARARGRSLRRAMFPAALALVPAMVMALILRAADAASLLPGSLEGLAIPLGRGDAPGLLMLSGVFCLGLWLGARGPRRAAP